MKLKFGTTRTVILVGKYAIKVPSFVEWRLFLLGLLGNMQETKFSKTGWKELCPVVFSAPGGFLNVMLRTEPISRDFYDEFDFEKFLNTKEYIVPAEIKLDSFGWLNGNLVAVDYGS